MNPLKFDNFTDADVKNNYSKYKERLIFYKKRGFDQLEARENIIEHIRTDSDTLLEIGTGKGYLTTKIAQIIENVTSIDLNIEDQKIAILNAAHYNVLDRISFITANAESLTFKDKSFDSIVSAFTFHHLANPFAVIREMIRLTKKQIIITDFNNHGFVILNNAHKAEGRNHDKGHSDFRIVGTFLEEYGFSVRKIVDEWQIIFVAERRT